MKYVYFSVLVALALVFSVLGDAQSVFAYTTISENISSDTTWVTGEVYVINGRVEVDPDVNLIIQPGAIIKFNFGAYLVVFGSVIADGTSLNKIYFTSKRDDSVGGDTNGDGSTTIPTMADWGRLIVATGGSIDLNYSVVRFGGALPGYANITQEGGNLNVSNSIIEYTGSVGINISGGTSIIENSIFRGNSYGMISSGPGSLTLNNNTFTDNYSDAIYISFDNNKSFVSSGNIAFGNGRNGFFIWGTIQTDQTWTDQMPYIISGAVEVSLGTTLTMNPGTTVKFAASTSKLNIRGELLVNGSLGNEVYFTSIKDDAVGGDTNGDGPATGPVMSDWGEINIYLGSANFKYSVVRFGGAGITNSNIAVGGGTLVMSNSLIATSGSTGLKIYDGSANITDSIFTDNGHGIIAQGGSMTIANSSIYNNRAYGIYNGTFSQINAENNWWGDATGPYNFWNNDGGLGDKVSTLIDFDPWLTSPPVFNPPTLKEPVIIVPGILGSYLNRVSDGEEIWVNSLELIKPGPDLYLNQLKLDSLGNEILDIDSTGILEREFLIFPFYENLINEFEDEGYIRDTDLVIFHYDWRKDISALALQMKETIDAKAGLSPSGKVNIVAHSMGSLLTKEYLRQNELNLSNLNKVVFAGSPQLGAIKAFKLINFGDNLNIPILNSNTAKDISQNMPSIYQLLPSREYIVRSGGYVEDHRNGQNRVLNYDEVKDFMLNDSYLLDHRNEALLNTAEQFHQNLDSLNINGPNITNLVGCSVDTLAGIKLYDKKKADISMKKGDGTVPFISAKHIFSSQNQSNYYAARGLNHFDLVSDDQALSLITAIVTDQAIPSLSDISSSDSICQFDAKKFFLFSTHSPVNLRVYDEQGNYVGLNEVGDVNIGIAESDFIRIGENNFVLVPEGHYRAVVDAYAIGSFDFKIRVLSDDVEDSAVYLNIPINEPTLNAEIYFDGEFEDILLNIDDDGNGSGDDSLAPNFIIFRLSTVIIEGIIANIDGAYGLGWIENKAREYLIKRLEHVDKLREKDEPKDDEIEEVLSSLLLKLDDYLGRGLIDNQAYDIIKEDIGSLSF